MTVTVRFAPSPTGLLHVGNARTAVLNALIALKEGGRLILRVDDTDQERSKPEYEAAIEDDLAWLGLAIDDKVRQSERFARYDAAVEALKAKGLLYPCWESEEELERKRKLQRAQGLPPVYDRAALDLSEDQKARLEAEGRKPHWRFKLSHGRVEWDDLVRGPSHIETSSLSDPILVREDGSYLYTLPSVVDDIELKITQIIRGEDHVTNSGAQIEVFRALGGEPPAFAHMPLLVGAEGDKLSKRIGSLSLQELRGEGIEPMALASHLAKIGTSDPVEARADLATLAAEFDFAKVGRAPARFDVEELKRLNAQLLHGADYLLVKPQLEKFSIDMGEEFWNAVRANTHVIATESGDALTTEDGFRIVTEDSFTARDWYEVIYGKVKPVIEDPEFTDIAAQLVPEGPYDTQTWSVFVTSVKEQTGRKGKHLFMPLRLALTGMKHGPDMAGLFALIGEEKARARLSGKAA